jgi:hypothetical protein
MEHSINLAAGHFAQVIAPTSSSQLLKRLKCVLDRADNDDDEDLDGLDAAIEQELGGNTGDDADADAEEADEHHDLDSADAPCSCLLL